VFVLALRRYPELCADTSFVTGRGQRHRTIQLCPIVRALGAARTAALPGFHAWSGADVTGNFAFKGKLESWNAGKRFLKLMKNVSLHLQISALPSFPQWACSMR